MSAQGDTVLIAVDGSEYSDYGIQFYMQNIHKPGNTVIFAHATEMKTMTNPAVMMSGQIDMSMVTQHIDAEEEKTKNLVEALTNKMKHMDINYKIEHSHGDAGPTICTIANNVHADYIVIGCRGKNTLRRTFTGSVTDYVTHHAHVPVLIARHKDHLKHHHHFHLKNPFKHKDHKEHKEEK